MNKDSNDVDLIASCTRGDRSAMNQLVLKYQQPVYNVAYRILGNAEDAADLTQTVFLKVFKSLEEYNSNYRFFSWLYRIAINESLNQVKSRRNHESLSNTEISAEPGPATQLDNKRNSERIQLALMNLNEQLRTVTVLKHYAGCSYQEISNILSLPEKTVKSRLYTARQQLKQSLTPSKSL